MHKLRRWRVSTMLSINLYNEYRKKEVRTHTALYKLQYKVHIP